MSRPPRLPSRDRYISKISPYFLIFVLGSIACILIGIFASTSSKKYNIKPDNACIGPNLTAADFDLPGNRHVTLISTCQARERPGAAPTPHAWLARRACPLVAPL